ncbi:DinB family protein [Pseudomonas oryzihabitans]|uniref:DinB family protein n=1 Tax=Pseudomonas oryzihabitans TaxID=47885 RepID=UPI002894B926|nr:DinB family protein [Pseudomonas oryzihabitans]MDT3719374.1 DinB family protein [Pseudomonas oryzihabitans]
MTTTLLLAQACNNRWSNHRLLAACATLSTDALHAPQPAAFFGSLWALLTHLLDVDRFYLDALHDQPRPYRDEDWPDLATLTAAQAVSDQRLIALCRTLDAEHLTQLITLPRATGPVREQRLRTLQHLFVHQLHHRGQAHALLLASGVAPPQLDEFFLAQDEPLRRAELQVLGIDEGELWGTTL